MARPAHFACPADPTKGNNVLPVAVPLLSSTVYSTSLHRITLISSIVITNVLFPELPYLTQLGEVITTLPTERKGKGVKNYHTEVAHIIIVLKYACKLWSKYPLL